MKHSLKTFCSQKADIYKSHSKKSKVFLKFLLTVMLLVTSILSYAQTGIGTTEPKGALDVVSSTGGFIMPRMNTATRTSITAGEEQKGMQIYDTDTKSVWLFNGTAWVDTLTSLALQTNDNGTAADTTDDFDELVYTDEDGTETKISVSSIETLTSLALQSNDGPDGTAGTDDDFDELVYTDEDGTETKINLTATETLTSLALQTNDGADGTAGTDDDFDELVYTDEDGTETKINLTATETLTSLALQTNDGADGTAGTDDDFDELVYTAEDGTETKINLTATETLTSLALQTNNNGTAGTDDDFDELVYTDEDGTETKISVSSIETLTSLALQSNDGPDGTAGTDDDFDELVYTDEDGTETKISVSSIETLTSLTLQTNDNGTAADTSDNFDELVYTDEDGTETKISLTDEGKFVDGTDVTEAVYPGNVGIGTTNPVQKLDVKGNTYVSGNVGLGKTTAAQKLDVVGNAVVSGSIGVGTTVPRAALDVVSTTSGFMMPRVTTTQRTAITVGTLQTGMQVYDTTTKSVWTFDGTNWAEGVGVDGGKFVDGTDVTEAVYPGNVGIGTTNPIQKLDVRGNTYVSGNVGLGKTTAAQKLDVVGNAVVSGSIGVGTTIPRAALDVVSTTSGFMMPRVTTTQRTAITAGTLQTGMQVYDTTTKSVWTFDGTNWVEANGGHIIGDIKQGLQTDDHNGWVKLDGRATSSLTSSQGLAAASIGISGSSIPDARNKVLMSRVGGSVNSTGGNNNVTIAKSNLPNYNMSGQTANGGFHSHYLSNGAAVTHRWGGTQWLSGSSTEYSGSASTSDMAVQGGGTHNHSLTVSTGGGGQALDITPSYLQVNTFIYLGN